MATATATPTTTPDQIRGRFLFTDPLRRLTTVRLDQTPTGEPVELVVTLRDAELPLHSTLPPTRLWTYDGLYPGPAIEVRRGQRVSVTWRNELCPPYPARVVSCLSTDPTAPPGDIYQDPQNRPGPSGGQDDPNVPALPPWNVVHLHGARVAPDFDGWTENAFYRRSGPPGCPPHHQAPTQSDSQRSHFPNDQPATMIWYHDHAMAITRLNVYAGLAGAWIIRDDEEDALGLPSGDRELTLILQDRNLDVEADGSPSGKLLHKVETLDPANSTMEFFGPFTLVNGTIWPHCCVKPAQYRVRVLNGSNARTYRLALLAGDTSDPSATPTLINDAFTLIGTDGGLLDRPASFQDAGGDYLYLTLAPAERVDLLVDFGRFPGQKLTLVNTAGAPFDGSNVPADPIHPTPEERESLKLPYPEVMRFDVEPGPSAPARSFPTLSPTFRRWDDASAELRDPGGPGGMAQRRYLALNESPAHTGSDGPVPDFLFFNELIADGEPGAGKIPVDFTLTAPSLPIPSPVGLRNRQVFFSSTIHWFPAAGKPEIWTIINLSGDTHPIHLHLVQFQVLHRAKFAVDGASDPDPSAAVNPDTGQLSYPTDKDGNPTGPPPNLTATPGAPDPTDVGWKDTVRVNNGEIVVIAAVFSGYTGRYMYHCHVLEHEDMEMMRPIVVMPREVMPFMLNMPMSGMTMSGMAMGGSPSGGMAMGGMAMKPAADGQSGHP